MSDQNPLLQESVASYLQTLTCEQDPALRQLGEMTQTLPRGHMRISAQQAQLMQVLIRLSQVNTVLEIGMFTGYSALAMALALPEKGQLITCDCDMTYYDRALQYWKQARVASKIQVIEGDAKDLLSSYFRTSQYQAYFDWIFIDADKAQYSYYVEASLNLLKSGGVLALDNTLYFGTYVHEQKSESAQIVARLNKWLRDEPSLIVSTIPIGGGLTIAYKQ